MTTMLTINAFVRPWVSGLGRVRFSIALELSWLLVCMSAACCHRRGKRHIHTRSHLLMCNSIINQWRHSVKERLNVSWRHYHSQTSLQKAVVSLMCFYVDLVWCSDDVDLEWCVIRHSSCKSFQERCIKTLLESWQREVTLWLHLLPFSPSTLCQEANMPACTAFIWDLEVFALCVTVLPQHTSLLRCSLSSCLLFISLFFLCSLSLLALPLSFSMGHSHRSDSIQLLCACDQLVNINSSSMTGPLWANTVCMWIIHGKRVQ